MNEQVVAAAQATVDAIDRQIAELTAARATLIKTFDLCLRVPTVESPPEAPEAMVEDEPLEEDPRHPVTVSEKQQQRLNWEDMRNRAMMVLGECGPMQRGELRQRVGIACRQVIPVLRHDWFKVEGRIIALSESGNEAWQTQRGASGGK